jgi:hypothetical protein
MLNQLTPLSNVIERSTRGGLLTHIFNTTLSIMLPRLATSGTSSPRRTPDTTGLPARDERQFGPQRQGARETCSEHLTALEPPLEERPAEIESPLDQASMAKLQLRSRDFNFEFVMEPTTSRLKLAASGGNFCFETHAEPLMRHAIAAEALGHAAAAEAVWQFLLFNKPRATIAAFQADVPDSLLSVIQHFIEHDPESFHGRPDIRRALTSFGKEPGRTRIADMANDIRSRMLAAAAADEDQKPTPQFETMIRATRFLGDFPHLFDKIISAAPIDACRMALMLWIFKHPNWKAACSGVIGEIIKCRDSLIPEDLEHLEKTTSWRQVELITTVAQMIKKAPSTVLKDEIVGLRRSIGLAQSNEFNGELLGQLRSQLDQWSPPDSHLNAS